MRNEGYRNAAIVVVTLIVFFLLSRVLSTEEYEVVLGICIVGVCLFGGYFFYKKKKFPVSFSEPDSEQLAMISDYFAKIRQETQEENKPMQYSIWTPMIISVIVAASVVGLMYSVTQSFFAILFVFVGIIVAGTIITKSVFSLSHHVDKICSSHFEVAKVNYFNASYYHSIRYNLTTYYVYVMYNGETIKLKVPHHVYRQVLSGQNGVGYLVKNSKGNGIYDIYDFVPEKYGSRINI